MNSEINPPIQRLQHSIGQHQISRANQSKGKQIPNKRAPDNNTYPHQFTRLSHQIKTFRGAKFISFHNPELASNTTVDHHSIRERAKARVFNLILKDELIQIEKDKTAKEIRKQKEEEKEIEMIKAKAKEFKNSNVNIKYKKYAKQIMSARSKLDFSMKTKKLKEKSLNRNDGTLNLSQWNKIDLSSNMIQLIRNKQVAKDHDNNYNANNRSKTNLNIKDNESKGKRSTLQLSEKNKEKGTKDNRVRDLTKFLYHFDINTHEKVV